MRLILGGIKHNLRSPLRGSLKMRLPALLIPIVSKYVKKIYQAIVTKTPKYAEGYHKINGVDQHMLEHILDARARMHPHLLTEHSFANGIYDSRSHHFLEHFSAHENHGGPAFPIRPFVYGDFRDMQILRYDPIKGTFTHRGGLAQLQLHDAQEIARNNFFYFQDLSYLEKFAVGKKPIIEFQPHTLIVGTNELAVIEKIDLTAGRLGDKVLPGGNVMLNRASVANYLRNINPHNLHSRDYRDPKKYAVLKRSALGGAASSSVGFATSSEDAGTKTTFHTLSEINADRSCFQDSIVSENSATSSRADSAAPSTYYSLKSISKKTAYIPSTMDASAEVIAEGIKEQTESIGKILTSTWSRYKTISQGAQPAELSFEQEIAVLSDNFQSLAYTASIFGHSKDVSKIATMGLAATKIARGMNALLSGAGNAGMAATINPYVGIAVGIASLAGLFMDESEDSSCEIILEAIQNVVREISRQMAENHEEIVHRLEFLGEKLEAHHISMLQEFSNIHSETGDIKLHLSRLYETYIRDSELIQGNLDYINQAIGDGNNALMDSLASLRIDEINEVVASAEVATQKTLPNNEFESHLNKLFVKAVTRAKDAHVTGSAVKLDQPETVSSALNFTGQQDVLHHPVFTNINLLGNHISQSLGLDTLQLAHPLIWIKCTDAFISILETKLQSDPYYPASEEDKQVDLKRLQELQSDGLKIASFIQEVSNNDALHRLLAEYQQSLQELSVIIQGLTIDFEQRKTKEFKESYERDVTQQTSQLRLFTCPQFNKLKALNAQVKKFYDDMPSRLKRAPNWLNSPNQRSHQVAVKMSNLTATIAPRAKDITQFSQNLTTQFNATSAEAIKEATQRYKEKLNALQFKLFEQNELQVQSSLFCIIFPEDSTNYSIPLLLPKDQIEIPQEWLVKEEAGLGIVRFEYAVDEIIADPAVTIGLTVKIYFVLQNKKILIGAINPIKPYTPNMLNAYTNDEKIWLHWYGGIYAKPSDMYNFSILGSECPSHLAFGAVFGPGFKQYSYSDYILPITPHAGVSSALPKSVYDLKSDDVIVTAQANNRREFNTEVIEQMRASTTSTAFKALTKIDMHFKLLDALLALMHSDHYHSEEFKALRNAEQFYLKDKEAIITYLKEYSSENSKLAETSRYLPYYLEQTSYMVQMMVQAIEDLELQPVLTPLNRTLKRVDLLIRLYKARAIKSSIPQQISSSSNMIQIAEQNQKIATLEESNGQLTQLVQLTRNELGNARQEIQLLQTKLDQVIQLLLAKKQE